MTSRPAVSPADRAAGAAPARSRALVPAGAGRGEPGPSDIGALFRDLRRLLKLSLPETARRLATRIDVVEALERGHFHRLPPWPETTRVVTAFTALGRIDAGPVLAAMRRHMAQQAEAAEIVPSRWSALVGRSRRAMGAVAPLWRRGQASAAARWSEVRRRAQPLTSYVPSRILGVRTWAVAAALAGVLPLLMLALWGVGGTLQAANRHLPEPLSSLARTLDDYRLQRTAPRRQGLVWIEVEDPASRKGDKLPVAGH